MATSTGVSCSICLKNGKDKAAIISCAECKSAICDLCRDEHDQSNKTINHKTISLDEIYKGAQIPIRKRNTQLRIVRTFYVTKTDSAMPGICAFCLLPNKDFVFVDRSGVFTVCNKDGSFQDRFATGFENTRDITSINNSTIAVSVDCRKHHVKLFDIKQKKENTQTIPTNDACMSMEYNKGMLYMATYGGGLCTANLFDNKVSDFFSIRGQVICVTLSKNNICMGNSYTDDITLFDPSANIIWKFAEKELLSSPSKLTSDANGNIYALGLYNVVFISADGNQRRQLLGQEDGIENVSGIHYDKDTKVLIIVNIFGSVTIYICP